MCVEHLATTDDDELSVLNGFDSGVFAIDDIVNVGCGASTRDGTPFAKARKHVETLFSQIVDQFMLCRNYAKQQVGLFARIISKVSALTILQYINFINNKPIGRVKYSLAYFRQRVI